MKCPTIAIVLLVALSSSPLRGESDGHRIYPYVFTESTGDNRFVLLDSNLRPLKAFAGASNVEAVNALRSLKASILYPNADGTKIFLQGSYHENDLSFRLDHWFIISPFSSHEVLDETMLPQEIASVDRTVLATTDFTTPVTEPAQYVRRYSDVAPTPDPPAKSLPPRSHDFRGSSLNWRPIGALSRLAWKTGGQAVFQGCNTGVNNAIGPSVTSGVTDGNAFGPIRPPIIVHPPHQPTPQRPTPATSAPPVP